MQKIKIFVSTIVSITPVNKEHTRRHTELSNHSIRIIHGRPREVCDNHNIASLQRCVLHWLYNLELQTLQSKLWLQIYQINAQWYSLQLHRTFSKSKVRKHIPHWLGYVVVSLDKCNDMFSKFALSFWSLKNIAKASKQSE